MIDASTLCAPSVSTTVLPPDPSLMRALAALLLADAPRGALIDLTDTVVIVPASRARASLCRHLQDMAGKPVLLPTVLTPGRSVSHFILPDQAVACDEAIALAVLRSLDEVRLTTPSSLDALLPSAAHALPLLPVATRIAAVLTELARAECSAQSVLARGAAAELGHFFPDEIWQSLALIESHTVERLNALGLGFAHSLAARAIRDGRLATDGLRRVVVLLADPDPTERTLLRALAERGIGVTVAVHAADLPALADGFPDHKAWSSLRPHIPLERIVRVATVNDQPGVVLTAMSALPQPVAPASLAIAALGPTDAAIVARTLGGLGIDVAQPPSRDASQGAAALLVRAVSAWLSAPTALQLGTLVRHPWIESALADAGVFGAVKQLTTCASTSGMHRMDGAGGIPAGDDRATAVHAAVTALLTPLAQAGTGPLIAHELLALLRCCSPSTSSAADAIATEAVANALVQIGGLPSALVDPCTLAEIAELALAGAARTDLPSDAASGIPCMGWLDAGVCDAPNIVVLSANDGLLPEAASVDPWLPDSLRASLGMPCSRARRARDAWMLDGLLKRKDGVWFGLPSKQDDREPLRPSRFVIGGSEQAARVQALTDDVGVHDPAVWEGGTVPGPGFTSHPTVDPLPTITAMAVTDFSEYIKCPYHYLLTRVLKVDRRDDLGRELDPMAFGSLVHTALANWGNAEVARDTPTTDARIIATELHEALDAVIANTLAASVHGAVTAQVQMARERLQAFANRQATWAQQGWTIKHIELSFRADGGEDSQKAIPFPDATGLLLKGRIDRVDHHAASGRWAALDYKTSSDGKGVLESHRSARGLWRDLQLPLYRELLASMGVPRDQLTLGIVALPADPALTAFHEADWDSDALHDAVVLASDIVGRVQRGDFTPSDTAPMSSDPLLLALHGHGVRGLSEAEDSE